MSLIEQGTHTPGPVTGVDFHLQAVEITSDKESLVVQQIWSGVDRPRTGAIAVNDTALARRLQRAMLAGVAYPAKGVRQDIFGKTYVDTETNILGRTLNADLKRLGF